MKRDMDLVRKILLKLEDTPYPNTSNEFTIQDYQDDQINYHIMLLNEAGLIEATDMSSEGGFYWSPERLTWDGYEFLEASRDESRWKKAINIVKEKGGGIVFDVLKGVLIQLMTKAVLG